MFKKFWNKCKGTFRRKRHIELRLCDRIKEICSPLETFDEYKRKASIPSFVDFFNSIKINAKEFEDAMGSLSKMMKVPTATPLSTSIALKGWKKLYSKHKRLDKELLEPTFVKGGIIKIE